MRRDCALTLHSIPSSSMTPDDPDTDLPGRDSDLRRRAIRSFVVRAGRMTVAQERAWQELWPRYGIETGATARGRNE